MTKSERAALRELEAKASQGPWVEGNKENDNHRFIAAARNSLLPLLDALDDAEAAAGAALDRERDAIATSRAVAARMEDAEAVVKAARVWKSSYGIGVDDALFRAVATYDANHVGGPAVAPPRPAPTTVPSSGVPRQDSGRPKHGGGG